MMDKEVCILDSFLYQSQYTILYEWLKIHLSGYYWETSDKWALSLYQTNDQYKIYIHFYKSGYIEQQIKDITHHSVLYHIHFPFINFLQSTKKLNCFLQFIEELNVNHD